jgi:ABC-type glycerol-3-phosphate transport system permease component
MKEIERKKIHRFFLYIGYITITFFMLFPVIWALLSSFKDVAERFRFPPTILPEHFTTIGYETVFTSAMPKQILNSITISVRTILLTLMVSVLGGFAFARATFRAKNLLLFFLVGTQMIPGLSNIITLYMIGSRLKILNTHAYLVFIYAAGSAPVCVWLMKGYFEQIPASLDEAAVMDGCSRLGILWHIILPLMTTGMAACALMVFVNSWNEFLVCLTMISRTALKTFPVGLQAFIVDNNTDWESVSAATILGLIPILILFISFQRYFIEGMTSGAIKA